MMDTTTDFFGAMTCAYSRTQAIEGGVLVDVSEIAKRSGFKIPVAVTRAVWDQFIEWTDEDNDRQTIQDKSGRLCDVLWMLYLACKRNKEESYINYELQVIPRDGSSKSPIIVKLKSVICGGDEGEPVITVMLPNED